MPQQISNSKSGTVPVYGEDREPLIDPLTGVNLNDAYFDDPSRYYSINFDPTETSSYTGKSIYQDVFNGFEHLYSEVTGSQIDLSKGAKYSKGFDRVKNPASSQRRTVFEQRIVEESNKSIPYEIKLGQSQKDEHINRWAGEAQGLIGYLEQYLPPAGTDEGRKMADLFYRQGGFVDQTMDKFVSPMVKHGADMLGEYHSVDTAGDWGKRTIASAQKTFGSGLQANKDLIGRMAKFIEPMYSVVQPGSIERTAEEYANDIFNEGKSWKEAGSKREEGAAPARGMYAQNVVDRVSKEGYLSLANIGYLAYKGTESIGSQAITTGLPVALSTIAQLHPATRGASFILRTAIGVGASTPGLAAGYILESGDAYESALGELKMLRQEAIDIRNSDKKAWEAGTSSDGFKVPYFNGMTADMLNDKQLEEFAGSIGREYGRKASTVEALGTILSAGIAYRQGAKQLGLLLNSKEAQQTIVKGITRNAFNNLKAAGKGFAGTVFTESLTEGLQEYIQESILARELPRYELNTSQVWDAAYAGGIFGGGMSATSSSVSSYKGYRDQKLKEETQEQKNIRAADQISKGKVIKDYDEVVIGASLLGVSLEEIVERISAGDKSPAALAVENELRGRYTVLAERIDEISNDPARAAGFFKKHKTDLELMGFSLNETSLGSLVLQPEQIAEILGVKVEELSSDEVIPKKRSPAYKVPTVDEKNAQDLQQEFGDIPEVELDAIDQYDPTMDVPMDPTLGAIEPDFIDNMLEQSEKSDIELIEKEIERLEDLSNQIHLSPLDREVAIADLQSQKDEIMQKSTSVVTSEGKSTNYRTLKVNEMKEIALARKLDIKEPEGSQRAGKDLLRADLISLLEESDLDTKPKSIAEAGRNHAKKIIQQSAQAVHVQSVPIEILSEFDANLLINHAKNIALDVSSFVVDDELVDREGLISAIAKYQGPHEMNAGIPLFWKQKNRSVLHKTFRQGYFELLKKVPELGSSEGLFRKWVEQHVGPSLPDHLKVVFYDWANTFAPNQTLANEIAWSLYDKVSGNPNVSQAFQSDVKDIEEIFRVNTDWTREAIGQQDTEGSDIHTENFTHLNSAFFEAMGVVLKKDKIDEITDLAKNSITFEDFVTAISSDEIGLRSDDGLTAANLVAGDSPLKRKLKQFYVGNLVENNVVINDGEWGVGDYDTAEPGKKTVQAKINHTTKNGWGNVVYTNKGKGRQPGWARATMADRFIKTPIIWLNGKNVTKSDAPKLNPDGKPYWGRSPIYGFLSTEDIKELTATRFYEKGLVPLFIKGDADRIGLIEVTDEHRSINADQYWVQETKDSASETKDGKPLNIQQLGHDYLGNELTEAEMIAAYGSVQEFQAAGIARHEAYKELLGDDYPSLTAHEIMHRIKILFTPATTRTGGNKSTLKLIDLKDSRDNNGELFTRTTYDNGDISKKNLIIFANGKNQYAGDGMTITSERVFKKKYFEEVGANPLAKRAKTIKVVRDGNNTLLMKHQEMTFNLPENAKKSEIFNGTEKVAEIRRENGEINIYVQDSKGAYNRYIDHLATTDEAKVRLGEFTDFDKVHELPSEATGHIQFTEADKQKAPFPMQVTNYLNDPGFLKELNALIEDPTNPASAARVIDHMINISQNPEFFNNFLQTTKHKHPDSMPRMIIEMANLGAGLHPTQLDYGSVLVKNRLFTEAMDVKQEGGVLDFRPNFVSNIEKGKIVLPYGHSLQLVVARKLAEIKRIKMDADQIMRLSKEDLNKLIKENPVKVMLVRHPVPSRAGYRMLTVDSFENGLGDSFMINDEDVKEVFEGDYDHDTGHISILPDGMTHQLIKNQTFQDEMAALSLDQWADKVQDSSIGDFNSVMDLMGEMTWGETAIGEIANVQRIAGIAQTRFGKDGYIEIYDPIDNKSKKVMVKNLRAKVYDPALGEEMSLEQLFRHYAQAAFDNVSLRLLKQWDYSQDKLYKMLFYNEDGTDISDAQYDVLNASIIRVMKKTQAIKNGRQFGKNLKLEELMNESDEYNRFVSDPENYLIIALSEKSRRNSIEVSDGKFEDAINLVSRIKMNDELHPHEKLAIMPIQKLNLAGITPEEFFKLGSLESKVAHNESYKEVSTDSMQLGFIMKALGASTLQQMQNQDHNAILNQMQSGNEWGAYMRTAMNEVYKTIEQDENTENSKIANSMTWDYNVDFVEFVDKWLDGFDRGDGPATNLSGTSGISIMRDSKYGNPFVVDNIYDEHSNHYKKLGYTRVGSIKEAIERYDNWLRGTDDKGYLTEKRNEILKDVKSGILAGKTLKYYKPDASDSHAVRLMKLIEEARPDVQHQKGFNELTEIEKIAATYTFLGGIHDAETGFAKRNVRKIPPVSSRDGESLLHPGVMQEYFSNYNKTMSTIAQGADLTGYEDMTPAANKFQQTIKEYLGCE